MPVQFEPIDSVTPKEPTEKFNKAIDIIQKKFPQFLEDIDVTVEATWLGEGTNGTYNDSKKRVKISPYRSSTEDIVSTLLHELNHAQTATKKAYNTLAGPFGNIQGGRELVPGRVGDYKYAKDSGLEAKGNELREKAVKLGMPSVSTEDAPLYEILATATAAYNMDQIGMKSPFSGAVSKLLEDPQILDWVKRNQHPTKQALKSWEPSMTDNLIDSIKSWFGNKPKQSQAEKNESKQ